MKGFLIALFFGFIAFAGNTLINSFYFKPMKKDVSAIEVIFKDSKFYVYANYMESKNYIPQTMKRNTGSNVYFDDFTIQNFCKTNDKRQKELTAMSPKSPAGKKARNTILEQGELIQKQCLDTTVNETTFYPSIKEPIVKQIDTLEFLREMSYRKKFKFN